MQGCLAAPVYFIRFQHFHFKNTETQWVLYQHKLHRFVPGYYWNGSYYY